MYRSFDHPLRIFRQSLGRGELSLLFGPAANLEELEKCRILISERFDGPIRQPDRSEPSSLSIIFDDPPLHRNSEMIAPFRVRSFLRGVRHYQNNRPVGYFLAADTLRSIIRNVFRLDTNV